MPWDLKNYAKPLEGCSKSRFDEIRFEVVSGRFWDRFFIDFGSTFGRLGGPWDVFGTSVSDVDFQ